MSAGRRAPSASPPGSWNRLRGCAALPHLVEAAPRLPPSSLQSDILIYVGMMRGSRDDRSRERPAPAIERAWGEEG
mgnify:CR=1 FL=1